MKIIEALNILGISVNTITQADIKAAYRKAAAKYHPDHNPAGLEMMKLINVAYETLKDFSGHVTEEITRKDYGDAINNALNAIINLGLTIEVCGVWVWVTGDTRPHREVLKAAGYKWASQKKCWYFRPEEKRSFNRKCWSMSQIRATYGSRKVNDEHMPGFSIAAA